MSRPLDSADRWYSLYYRWTVMDREGVDGIADVSLKHGNASDPSPPCPNKVDDSAGVQAMPGQMGSLI